MLSMKLVILLTQLNWLIITIHGICLGDIPRTCLENLDEERTKEVFEYVLRKYEGVERKIVGKPVEIHGKRITYGSSAEELHIVFHYIDNTPNDVIQTCTFVVSQRIGECETISTICNTFVAITPRPLLQLEDLTVCEDDEDAMVQGEQAEARTEGTTQAAGLG